MEVLKHVLKVFLYAFLGVLIPECVAILNGMSLNLTPAAVVPLVCAAVSAGLAAVWSCVSRLLARDIADDEVCDAHVEELPDE